MLANIKDLGDHIKQILEFNASALTGVQEQELYDMRRKLEYISDIQKHLISIRENSSLYTPESEQEQEQIAAESDSTTEDTFTADVEEEIKHKAEASANVGTRQFADSPNYNIPPLDSSSSSDNPCAPEIERKKMVEANNASGGMDIKAASEFQSTLKTSDSTPSLQELIFSKALARSLKRDKRDASLPPLSPTSAASTVVSMDNQVEELIDAICDDCVKPIAPETMQSPQTQYRTISLSTSSPRG